MKFELAGEFLLELKKEFRGGDKKLVKVTELRRVEQVGRTIKEFVQEFWKAVRGSEYKERVLVKEFKSGMNGMIRKKLMEAERLLLTIKQWYKCATNLDRHWRESQRERERLRGKREEEN